MDKLHWMVRALFSSGMLLGIFCCLLCHVPTTDNCSAKQCLLLPLVVEQGTSLKAKGQRGPLRYLLLSAVGCITCCPATSSPSTASSQPLHPTLSLRLWAVPIPSLERKGRQGLLKYIHRIRRCVRCGIRRLCHYVGLQSPRCSQTVHGVWHRFALIPPVSHAEEDR
jgi:hypothetical protein